MVKESAGTIHFDDQSVCCSLSVFSWSVDLPINLSVHLPV